MRVCPKCKGAYEEQGPDGCDLCGNTGFDLEYARKNLPCQLCLGQGCEACHQTGREDQRDKQ